MSTKKSDGMEVIGRRPPPVKRARFASLAIAVGAGVLTQVAFNVDDWRRGAADARSVGASSMSSDEAACNAITVMQRDAIETAAVLRSMLSGADQRAALARVALDNIEREARRR